VCEFQASSISHVRYLNILQCSAANYSQMANLITEVRRRSSRLAAQVSVHDVTASKISAALSSDSKQPRKKAKVNSAGQHKFVVCLVPKLKQTGKVNNNQVLLDLILLLRPNQRSEPDMLCNH
jgi:hypothetical protein